MPPADVSWAYDDDDAIDEEEAQWDRAKELLELRLRTAVGNGNELVEVVNAGLEDEDCRFLVHLLTEAERGAKTRYDAARKAQALADKARAENDASDFNPFAPEPEPDLEEEAFKEACRDEDELENLLMRRQQKKTEIDRAVASGNGGHDDDENRPLSYRFTPREERSAEEISGTKVRVGRHAAGRARVLFRRAMQRHDLRQKALIAAAAVAAVEYEEGGRGCHQLHLQSNAIGSRGVSQLCTFVRATEVLHALALGGNPLGDTGAALLGRALMHTRVLRTLSLQDCDISPRGMRHLSSGLARNRSLRELWLQGNQAADEGAASVAGALRSCRLESLGLERNRVRARGGEAISLALALPTCTLMWLRLSHNDLGDAGVSSLASALSSNTSLARLQLRAVGVGSRGLLKLAEVLPLHEGLTSLGLEENRIDPKVAEKLLQVMPRCKLSTLSLDQDHGGRIERVRTRDDFNRGITIAALAGHKKRQDETDDGKMARSYVGKFGVTNHLG